MVRSLPNRFHSSRKCLEKIPGFCVPKNPESSPAPCSSHREAERDRCKRETGNHKDVYWWLVIVIDFVFLNSDLLEDLFFFFFFPRKSLFFIVKFI